MPLEKERSGPPWGVRTWGGYTAPFQCYGYERLGNGKAGIMLYKKMLRKHRHASKMGALIQKRLKGTELAKMLALIVKKKFLITIAKSSLHVQQSLSLDHTAILCNAGGGRSLPKIGDPCEKRLLGMGPKLCDRSQEMRGSSPV